MLTPLAGNPVAYRGFSDTHRGSLSIRRTDDVCIKKLRIYDDNNRERIKKVSRSHDFLPKPPFSDKALSVSAGRPLHGNT